MPVSELLDSTNSCQVAGVKHSKVFLVNHSPVVLSAMEASLADIACDIRCQSTLSTGSDSLFRWGPDVIVMEFCWWDDRDDTWSAIRQLRTTPETRLTPIVLCTGHTQPMIDAEPALARLLITPLYNPIDWSLFHATVESNLPDRAMDLGVLDALRLHAQVSLVTCRDPVPARGIEEIPQAVIGSSPTL